MLAGAAVGFGLLVAARIGPAAAAPLAQWPGIAAAALCLGAAWLLDDPSSSTVASTPTPLALRRTVTIALALPVLAGLWAIELAYATQSAGGDALFGPDTRGALSLEFAAMLAFTLAAAALSLRIQPEGRGSWAAIVAVFGLFAISMHLPERWALLAGPADPAWPAAHIRWSVLLAAALLVLALTSREPSSRPAWPRSRRIS